LCDRERDLRAEDVERHAGDWTTLYYIGPLEGSGGRSRGRQVPRDARVAAACGISAVVAKRAGVHDFRRAVVPGAERDDGSDRTRPERSRTECTNHGAELARSAWGAECAIPGPSGGSSARRDGSAGSDARSDGHLRHGGLQRESPDEGARHTGGVRRPRDSLNKHGRGAPNGTALRRIVGGAAVERFRQPATGADCVSGESARSGSRHWRGLNKGLAGDLSVCYSGLRALAVDPSKLLREE